MFDKSAPKSTVLVLDIENGSVGSGIVDLSPGQAPRLWAQTRTQVPVMDTRSAARLMQAVSHAASESLLRASEVSAKLRHHAGAVGPVGKVALFMAAPWGVPNLSQGRPDFMHALKETLDPRIHSLFGAVPVGLHAHASAAVHGLRSLYPHEEDVLILSINGELSELLLIEGGHVVGHATAPIGTGTILRTLRAHAGMTLEEARSALKLRHDNEASRAAAAHFAGEFKEAAHELMQGRGRGTVYIVADDGSSSWFAHALGHHSLAGLYPKGGVVRVLRHAHVAPYIASFGSPDLHVALGALYTNAALGHTHRGH